MESSRRNIWVRRVLVAVPLALLFALGTGYAAVGWRYMAMGNGFVLDYTITPTADPPYTVVVSVKDHFGNPVSSGSVHLDNTSGGNDAKLDTNGQGSVELGEPFVDDIEFLACESQPRQHPYNFWTRFVLSRGGFSVKESGARLDIRLR